MDNQIKLMLSPIYRESKKINRDKKRGKNNT